MKISPLVSLEGLNNAAKHPTKGSRFISLNSTQITPELKPDVLLMNKPIKYGEMGKITKAHS
jgi:hypothetical protein